MLLFSAALRMAIANKSETETIFIFFDCCFKGIVSQTTNSAKTLFSIFSYALPLKTGGSFF
jgi:hypothetical protein